ncbi:MAG: hypothetical protein P1U63_09840 [Coxiellaceae bacterium]|nr:hypothetical protein [Coxiellaceae bacterium]
MHLDRFNQRFLKRFPTVENNFFVRRVTALQKLHVRIEDKYKREQLLERSTSAVPSTHYSPRLQAVATTQSDSELLNSDNDSTSASSPVPFQ